MTATRVQRVVHSAVIHVAVLHHGIHTAVVHSAVIKHVVVHCAVIHVIVVHAVSIHCHCDSGYQSANLISTQKKKDTKLLCHASPTKGNMFNVYMCHFLNWSELSLHGSFALQTHDVICFLADFSRSLLYVFHCKFHHLFFRLTSESGVCLKVQVDTRSTNTLTESHHSLVDPIKSHIQRKERQAVWLTETRAGCKELQTGSVYPVSVSATVTQHSPISCNML